MQQIVINGASFTQRVTGVQRYARELGSRLLNEAAVRLILPAPLDDEEDNFGGRVRVLPSGPLGAWFWVNTTLPRSLAADELLWSPTIRAPLRARRHVATVHDLSVLDHPEWFRRSVVLQWRALLPALCTSTVGLLTDSEFSRERMLQRLNLAEDRVQVVPCGVDARFSHSTADEISAVRRRYELPDRFMLFVGSADPRKNVSLLVSAWRTLVPQLRDEFPLVIAGGSARTFAAEPGLTDLPDSCRKLGYVDDTDLPALYAAASVFAYPSLYEGFGLPPLEAMAAGTPVVALAATGAVAEVVGDAGILVEDATPAGFAEGLRTALDPAQGSLLAVAGRERARLYSWESAASVALQALRALGANSNVQDCRKRR